MPSAPLPRAPPKVLVPMKFPTITCDSVASRYRPTPVLPLIRLSSMVNVLGFSTDEPSMRTPSPALGRAVSPSAVSPTVLPSMIEPLPLLPSTWSLMKIPCSPLPLTTFRSAAAEPPMVTSWISADPPIWMPSSPLPRSTRPVTSVPMRFPTIVMPSLFPPTSMPSSVFPEMRLYGPIVASILSSTWTPLSALADAAVPAAFVPM